MITLIRCATRKGAEKQQKRQVEFIAWLKTRPECDQLPPGQVVILERADSFDVCLDTDQAGPDETALVFLKRMDRNAVAICSRDR